MSGPPADRVRLEQAGPVVWLTLARPEKANALDRRMVDALAEALTAAEQAPGAQALVIIGAGANFCGGADLGELLAGGREGVRRLLDPLRDLLLRLEASHLAVVAAVHGAARAGGLELVLACDVVIAARSASFGDAHLARGLLPAGGSTARLPRTIGWQRAKWLILSAAAIDAETACAWGLALEVVPDVELKAAAERVASALAQSSGETRSKAKHLIARAAEQPLAASLEAELAALEAHYDSGELQAGVRTFLGGGGAPERHRE